MNQKPSILRYCMTMIIVVLLLLGTVTGINVLVDPFSMYRKVEIAGFNAYKPAIHHHMRLYKAFEIQHMQPQTIILGSSRPHVGLRCSHPALAALEGPCYNLAFDGASPKEMYYYLLHAQEVRPLKHIVLGLDSYHASPAPAFTRPDFDPLLLYSPGIPHWLRFITADLRLLTSVDMLHASMQTVFSQTTPEPNWYAPDGQRLGEIFFRQAEPTFMQKGPRAYFDDIDRQEVQDQITPAPTKKRVEEPANPQESSRAYVQRIIAFCREHHIDLRIFITPSHAHQSEIAALLWGEQSFKDNKRALVQLLSEDQTAHPDNPPIPLMDFSGYSSVTTEPLPPFGSHDEMLYYWDSSHFKQIVGDYVLDRLFAMHSSVPSDFGVVLNAQTLDAVLTQQHEAQAAYRKHFPYDISELRALLPGLPILVYHQIDTSGKEPLDKSTSITLAEFEGQMRYLHDQGYTTLSMDDVMRYVKGEPFPSKVVAIHFDDGWQSTQDAVPVLNRFGFKATFWIIAQTGNTGWPHMDWGMIQSLAMNPNFDFYSHTMTHPWEEGETLIDWVNGSTTKGLAQANWELMESRHILEEKLGRPVPYLAWPRGLYNDPLIKLAQKADYSALLTIDGGFVHPGDDPLRLRRIMIHSGCDASVFRQILADGKHRDCLAVVD